MKAVMNVHNFYSPICHTAGFQKSGRTGARMEHPQKRACRDADPPCPINALPKDLLLLLFTYVDFSSFSAARACVGGGTTASHACLRNQRSRWSKRLCGSRMSSLRGGAFPYLTRVFELFTGTMRGNTTGEGRAFRTPQFFLAKA
jgi:hypothetical protein